MASRLFETPQGFIFIQKPSRRGSFQTRSAESKGLLCSLFLLKSLLRTTTELLTKLTSLGILLRIPCHRHDLHLLLKCDFFRSAARKPILMNWDLYQRSPISPNCQDLFFQESAFCSVCLNLSSHSLIGRS